MTTQVSPIATDHAVSLRLPGDAASIGCARRAVDRLHGNARDVADVRLLVDEMVTDAVCDGADPIDLRIDVPEDRVRVEVLTPYGRSAPRPGGDLLAALSARVIDAIADAHGTGSGVAWAEMYGDVHLDTQKKVHIALPGWGCEPDVW